MRLGGHVTSLDIIVYRGICRDERSISFPNNSTTFAMKTQELLSSLQKTVQKPEKDPRGCKIANYVNSETFARSNKRDKNDRDRKDKRYAKMSYPKMIIKDDNVSKSIRLCLKPYQCK